jgi:carbon-monoxide dehydrogenase large subunit
MGQFGIGQPVPRTEDPRLLKGAGSYIDDVTPAGCLRGFVVRAPFASATFKIGDLTAARSAPGVHVVLTSAELASEDFGLQRPLIARNRADGSDAFAQAHPYLVDGRVRYLGDNVAFIVADTVNQAKDAADLIDIDWQTLPAVASAGDAVAPNAPAVWDDCPGNDAFLHTVGDKAAVDAAFETADHIVSAEFAITRLAANPMEPRGCTGFYNAREDRYELRASVQGPHQTRTVLSKQVLKVPPHKIHVVCENMGGGFGMKGSLYNEYLLCLWASKIVGHPVKWMSERTEAFLSDDHARDNLTTGELALDKDGQFLALRVSTLANIGAYYNSDRVTISPTVNLGVLAGTYTTPAIHAQVTGVMTHTRMNGPYRGAGRPEAAYIIEALIDKAALRLDIDPAELRLRNTIPADALPFKTGLVYVYDSGDFAKNLTDCMEMIDYASFAARRDTSSADGLLRGIGISNTIERAAALGLEAAEIRFDPTGGVTLLMGTNDHGQGHQTTFSQIVSERLGIAPEDIRYIDGDTDKTAMGTGTFGSRSATLGGSAVNVAANKIVEKGKRIAAHLLEAASDDITFAEGSFTVTGTDKSVSLKDIAITAFTQGKLPRDIEPGLCEIGTFEPDVANYPNGAHICEVEIDRETGTTRIVRYCVVDDVGTVINPLLLKGQIHGGIAQGVGQALMEDLAFDEDAQIVAGSFMDYAMPRADQFCDMEVSSNEFPTSTNPLGVKGAGEAGTVGSLPAVMAAVNNALSHAGAGYVEMPATSEKVWRALREATVNR